ncbi:MAG: diguanylate cyclase [Christensenella sp.]
MIKFNTKKLHIALSVIILLCIIIVLIYNGVAPMNPPSTPETDITLDSGWDLTIDNTTKTDRTLPISVVNSSSTIAFSNTIPAHRTHASALCISFYTNPFTVYFNDEKIYEYGIDAMNNGYLSVGSGHHVIPLPDGAGTVRIETVSMPKSPGAILSYASVMPAGTFYNQFIRHHIITIFAIMILFSVFIYTVVSRRSRAAATLGSTYSLAAFALSTAIWLAARSGLLQFFTSNLILINAIDFLSFFLLPLTALLFVQQWLHLPDRRLKICIALGSAFIIVASLLHILRIVDFTKTLIVFHPLLIADIICILISVFRAKSERALRTNILRVSVIILVSGAVTELIIYYLMSFKFLQFSFLELALLLFTLCMFYVWSSESQQIRENLSRGSVFRKMAYTDELTGLSNRAAFELAAEKSRDFDAEPLYLFMIDLNELKKINDSQGHYAGDTFIENSVRVLKDALPSNGKLFRFGGDEFVILLPGGDKEAAELYRKLLPYLGANDRSLRASFSVGYAVFDPAKNEDLYSVLRRADKRMYACKSKLHDGQSV